MILTNDEKSQEDTISYNIKSEKRIANRYISNDEDNQEIEEDIIDSLSELNPEV